MSLGTELFQWGPGAKPRYGGLGNEVPQMLKQFTDRHCLQILTAETIKIRKFRTKITSRFLINMFHGAG